MITAYTSKTGRKRYTLYLKKARETKTRFELRQKSCLQTHCDNFSKVKVQLSEQKCVRRAKLKIRHREFKMSYSRRSSRYSLDTELIETKMSSSRADAYSDIFEEGRRVLQESRQKTIDWDEKMQDYATQRRLRTRRLMRKK